MFTCSGPEGYRFVLLGSRARTAHRPSTRCLRSPRCRCTAVRLLPVGPLTAHPPCDVNLRSPRLPFRRRPGFARVVFEETGGICTTAYGDCVTNTAEDAGNGAQGGDDKSSAQHAGGSGSSKRSAGPPANGEGRRSSPSRRGDIGVGGNNAGTGHVVGSGGDDDAVPGSGARRRAGGCREGEAADDAKQAVRQRRGNVPGQT